MSQLPLPLPREKAAAIADALAELLGERVHLTVTDNTSTMVSYRRHRELLRVRVHRMFVDAPQRVVHALAAYTEGSVVAGQEINSFIRQNEEKVRQARRRRHATTLDPKGSVYDLQVIFDQLNESHFSSKVEATIGWGRGAYGKRKRRSIRMGVYLHDSRVIRIHPALDRDEVPLFFVRFVVFHEMLHQVVPPQVIGGRRMAHPPAFRELERRYEDYEAALAWERENLGLLLRPMKAPEAFDPDDPLA